MDYISQYIISEGSQSLILILLIAILVWFLPALVAYFFNRKNFKVILFACIPAGLSLFAWVGLLAWSLSNQIKLPQRFQDATKKIVDKASN